MCVHAPELICSTGVLGFHTFKLALCIYNKLHSHAVILSWWAFDVTFPGSNPLRSNRSGLNVSNGGSWNPKFTLKVSGLWIKIKGQNFASQVLSRHTFKVSRKKGSEFVDHRGTLRAFNQLTIACELDMINAISAADIGFIMSSSTCASLLSLLECSPQKQNGGTLHFCLWGWIMWKINIIEFSFHMISWIIKPRVCVYYLP